MATSTRNGDHMDDQNVDWSLGLSLFGDFDPNLSFLDDSALLPGFTPDWTDYQAQNHHENSLTSNEASSDEGEPKKNPSANNLQAPRKRGRPRKTHHDSTPATPATSTTSHSQSSGRGQSQMDRNIDDTRYIYDDTRASASPHNSVALLLRNTNAGESASNSAHPTFLANNGPGAVLMSSRGTRCVTRRAAALRSGGDDGSGAYLGGRGKSSVTGRKKATEEARSVLMDWINDNKGTHSLVLRNIAMWCNQKGICPIANSMHFTS